MNDEAPSSLDGPRTERELDLFDYALIRSVIGYVLRGVGRHAWLSVGLLLAIMALGVAVVALLPRTYHAESRLLANQNELIAAIGNPRVGLPSDDPTRAARELIFANQNLISLVKQTALLKKWEEGRPLVVRAKDSLVAALVGPPSEQDQIEAMVGTLEKRLRVDTDRQTVSISIDWPDAQMAYLLVETAQQNFLETRHVTEMTAISEALAILEMHAGNVQKSVDDALHELERVREQRRRGAYVAMAPPLNPESLGSQTVEKAVDQPAKTSLSATTEQELAQVKFLINSKRRARQDLEESQQRRIAEVTTQLQDLRIHYGEQHPMILDAQQRLAAAKEDSPQMIAVKRDIGQLEEEYKRKGGRSPDSLLEVPTRGGASTRRSVPLGVGQALSAADLAEDPMVDFARNNLRVATAKYEDLMMRIDSARIIQDTARAAFKYRYSVIRPAAVPKKPVSPNVVVLMMAVLVAALGVALVSGSIRDALSGRYLESWQVERSLGLRVLSEVKAR
jgi:uncharacterized protein involved in exopolysaccharide biosynthesis